MERVGIIGVGQTAFRSTSLDLSYKELTFEAAVKAYEDANINPRKDVQSFVSVSEDFWEGTSIFDEYVPDQIGAAQKPVHTVAGDGIQGLIAGYMQILTGLLDVVVIEGHSKISDILTYSSILAFSLDPIYNRPLRANPNFIAGLEMTRFLYESQNTKKHCAQVVEKNKKNALANPNSSYGANISPEDVLASEPVSYPLNRLDISQPADGAVVIVLASEKIAKKFKKEAIRIAGAGWCSDTPTLETRDWSSATYASIAADMAYRKARINKPAKEIDVAEIDDTYSYKELQHMEALRLCRKGESGKLVSEGQTEKDGNFPVNPSGGSLGVGYAIDATGLMRVAEAVYQLRNQAGKHQVDGAETVVVQSWRGVPTTTGSVLILKS